MQNKAYCANFNFISATESCPANGCTGARFINCSICPGDEFSHNSYAEVDFTAYIYWALNGSISRLPSEKVHYFVLVYLCIVLIIEHNH